MSLTSQLQELIKFLAPLVAEDDEKPATAKTTAQQWRDLAETLTRAAENLGAAADELVRAAADPGSSKEKQSRFATGAESARDRAQWITELHDRALVYGNRAVPAPGPVARREAVPREETPDEKAAAGEPASPKDTAAPKTGWEAARSKLAGVQRTVETARRKLGEPDPGDGLALSFIQDLDLEAEMILVLRRRLEGVARRG